MEEIAKQTIAYLQASPLLNLVIAFIAGVAACKTVASVRRSGWLLSFVVGILGFFLAEFAIYFLGLVQYMDQIPAFRIVFDLIAAYFGSFLVAAIIHFLKPV